MSSDAEDKDYMIVGESSDEEEDGAEGEDDSDESEVSEEGKEMQLVEDADDGVDESHLEKKFVKRGLKEHLDNPMDVHDLDDDDDEVEEEEDYIVAFDNGESRLTRLRAACNGFVYWTMIQSMFENSKDLVAGKYTKVPANFLQQVQISQKTADSFYKDHNAFILQAERALKNGDPANDGALQAVIIHFTKCKTSTCTQIAAIVDNIYKGAPMLKRCAVTEKELCSEEDEGKDKFLDKTPGWLLITRHNDVVTRVPVCKGVMILAHCFFYMKNFRQLVVADVAAKILDYTAESPGRSHFHYVDRYASDPLGHAAKFYYHYHCAKDHVCEILRIPKNEADSTYI